MKKTYIAPQTIEISFEMDSIMLTMSNTEVGGDMFQSNKKQPGSGIWNDNKEEENSGSIW